MAPPKSLLKGFAKTIEIAKPDPSKRLTISDPDTRGLFVRITPKGVKTFTIVAVSPAGKQVWAAIGNVDDVTLDDARERAREGVKRIKDGLEPFPAAKPVLPPRTFAMVRDDYLKRCVRREGQGAPALRSSREVHRIFLGTTRGTWVVDGCKGEQPAIGGKDTIYIPQSWDDRPFAEIRRIDVTELMDAIEDKHGARQADAVLAQLSALFGWHAARADDYVSPIVRGMKRTRAKERQRKRLLSDVEIRSVWKAADSHGTFGAFVKVALMTGQRREKVASMRWADIVDGVWTIQTDDREKGNADQLKLPPAVLEIIDAQPQVADNPFVFAGRSHNAFGGFSKAKARFDEAVQIESWVIHDLRRTARSLMSRARVDREIAERVLGHVIAGVEGVYDRHAYFEEKAAALEKLARLVAQILNPPAENVVPISGAAA